MKTNQIRVNINAAHDEVFEFTIEPKNTPKWIDFIKSESIDTKQINVGTLYTNDFGTLTVTDYERNVFFELGEEETGYECSYSFKKIDANTTEITYFESMQDGTELTKPLEEKYFKKLKELLEK